MGLLDSVLGAVMNRQGGKSAGHSSAAGGLGGLIGLVASNPQLLQIITGLLSNTGAQGGLGALIGKFQQAGLGDAMNSWIGTGPNQAVSPDQMSHALGSDTISQIAAQLGLSPDQAADQMSQLLPEVINQVTPDGQVPDGGLGNATDLMDMLSGWVQR